MIIRADTFNRFERYDDGKGRLEAQISYSQHDLKSIDVYFYREVSEADRKKIGAKYHQLYTDTGMKNGLVYLTEVIDGNPIKTYSINASGAPNGNKISRRFDAKGNLLNTTEATRAGNLEASYTYDDQGRLISVIEGMFR